MAQDNIADLTKEILQYAEQGHVPEALLLLKDTLSKTDAVKLSYYIDNIDLILNRLSANDKAVFEDILAETRRVAAIRRREADIQAEKERNEKIEETLKFVANMAGKPQHVTEAFDRLTALIIKSDPGDIKDRLDKLKSLSKLFLPKRRKHIEEMLSAFVESTSEAANEHDESLEDFDVCTLIDDVEDILKGGSSFHDEAYCLLCDTINAFDSAAIISARRRIEELVSRFSPKQQRELIFLITGKAGAASTDKPVKAEVPTSVKSIHIQPETISIDETHEQDSSQEDNRPETEIIEISGLKLSWHAIDRIRRRGIRDEDIEAAIMFGRNVYAQGAEFYVVGKREIINNPAESKRLLKVEGIHVICSKGWIITAYKNKEPNRLKH